MDAHLRDLAMHQLYVRRRISRVADQKAMCPHNEEIAAARYNALVCQVRDFIGWVVDVFAKILQNCVNLIGIESSNAKIKTYLWQRHLQIFQFNRQKFAIPAALGCELIVRKGIGA